MSEPRAEAILDFWFRGEGAGPILEPGDLWWKKSDAIDQLIRERFEADLERAKAGAFASWEEDSRFCLALVILLDQLGRNMYRGTAASFAQDEQALAISRSAIQRGFDKQLDRSERLFLYMPHMHSEDRDVQRRSVELFDELGSNQSYAARHAEIIARFGRFPHRNEILGRKTTDEEAEFLQEADSSF